PEPEGPSVTVVGPMQPMSLGSRVRITGRWENDARHGLQLRAHTVLLLEPDTREGLMRYLGSGLIPGIGPAYAQRIVDRFGEDTLRVLDQEPHRLEEVQGLGPRRALAVSQAWTERRALHDAMVFLQSHGVTSSLAIRIFRKFGADTIRVVSENPFQLATEVWGIGFQKADQIATMLGIAKQAPQRLEAAVLFALHQAEERGHVFLPRHELTRAAAQIANVPEEHIPIALERTLLTNARQDTIEPTGPVVYRNQRFIEEAALAHGLARIHGASVAPLTKANDAIAAFEHHTGIELADEQRQAIQQAAQSPLLIITGGPGVGKTTLLRAILELFETCGLSVRLAAPTGRASRRMSETTGKDAYTVHRLLEFDPRGGRFTRHEKKPIEAGAIIVDESSMLDLTMSFALIRAIATGTRLVLVGDVDQLPSIGAGAVLRDIIDSRAIPCVRLHKVFRQASQSRIVANAHRIREGLEPQTPEKGDLASDFFIAPAKDAHDAANKVLLLVQERIPRQFHLDPVRDVQVLTPMRRGPAGIEALNERLQHALNPPHIPQRPFPMNLRMGDKVMQLRNDYTRDVFNGDLGFVTHTDPNAEQAVVEIDGRPIVYDRPHLDELRLSYACSIHKSQGSEYPAVVIPWVTAHFIMLSRNLLYTAVTRGQRLVVLVAEPRAIQLALSQTRREQRYSNLMQRLAAAVQQQPLL
ncbi:MAG TPA: ATP-dependent RecD-like DNA helicase, partial [Polyangiaceae bacterium]|nr:ATP-dependent RecD-like DNA helicase [Polyangiaceae bacterium]